MDGRCEFDAGQDGSFRIETAGAIVFVSVTNPGSGTGSWTRKPETRSSHQDFGDLRRNGACWQSSRVNVCAWSLGQRPQAQPQGQPQFQQQAQPQRPATQPGGGIRVQLVNRDANCILFANEIGDIECDLTAREHPASQFVMRAVGPESFTLTLAPAQSTGLSPCNLGVFGGKVYCTVDPNEMRSATTRWFYGDGDRNDRLIFNEGFDFLHIASRATKHSPARKRVATRTSSGPWSISPRTAPDGQAPLHSRHARRRRPYRSRRDNLRSSSRRARRNFSSDRPAAGARRCSTLRRACVLA